MSAELNSGVCVAERGYCVPGDLCPYDHGLDRIILDNVGLPPTALGLPGRAMSLG